jgi:ABC-type branched-subunit amino acid transport system substrate-binding protein
VAAQQLINEEKVEFLLGGACSDEFLASAPIAQAQKVISFSSTAASPEISTLGKYVFRTCPSESLAGKAAAGYVYNFDETKPKAKHFLELYQKEFNLEPGYPQDLAGIYDFIYLIKGAYEAGATDSDQISNWLYNLKNWEGALGTLEFDSHGDPKLAYSIRKITGSQASPVDTYQPSP